ncbi:DarT ssDNA thymidine ADP-ribosyltransferase family protein [Megasphaera elsdenii]|uniref:DarT ssDNA thymidine ADP-ribosyltransferase family protein n=1 Tax=Megasphaera elsdenii TaxID=907 RepID=UPI003D005616
MASFFVKSNKNHDYKNQKYIYHLTTFENLSSILKHGLLSRYELKRKNMSITDVADQDIIQFREENNLIKYIPFHFFMNTPFAGQVMHEKRYQNEIFVYIGILREYAKKNNFMIIPEHPMQFDYKMFGVNIYSYDQGMELINWEKMNERNYHDQESKLVCMAECLSPRALNIKNLLNNNEALLVVKNKENQEKLEALYSRLFPGDSLYHHFWVPEHNSMGGK